MVKRFLFGLIGTSSRGYSPPQLTGAAPLTYLNLIALLVNLKGRQIPQDVLNFAANFFSELWTFGFATQVTYIVKKQNNKWTLWEPQ